jgi:fructose-bisphosphate aldolase, class II
MRKLGEILTQMHDDRTAIGHFNVTDFVLLKAVIAAARELNVPVLVGASEGEREFLGTRQIAALVKSLREEFDFPIFLNADHTHSLPKALEAAKAGFDTIVFDLSTLLLEGNAKQTRGAVEALKSINPEILVEGEVGDIGSGSEIHDDMSRQVPRLTTASEARHFVEATRIDILAPSVGNAHGMRRNMVAGKERKHLDIERIREIKEATGIPLTLHGGSGTADEDLRMAIAAGINMWTNKAQFVHINTELRIAWRRGLEDGLHQREDAVVPYKILPSAVASVQQVVSSRLKLFTNPIVGRRMSG